MYYTERAIIANSSLSIEYLVVISCGELLNEEETIETYTKDY
jgi:hypothetical protein